MDLNAINFDTVKMGGQIGLEAAMPLLPFVVATRASESGWRDLGNGSPKGVVKIVAASAAFAYLSGTYSQISLLKLLLGREVMLIADATMIATSGLVAATFSSLFSQSQPAPVIVHQHFQAQPVQTEQVQPQPVQAEPKPQE